MTATIEICVGAKYHSPRYAETDTHHIYPKYLCSLLGLPERPETVRLCAQCHDNVHHVLRHFINTGTPGNHNLSDGAKRQVLAAWDWWQEQLLSDV